MIKNVLLYIILVLLVSTSSLQAKKHEACSKFFSYYELKYELPTKVLTAIGLQESGKFYKSSRKLAPHPWTINVHGKGYYFNSKQEALKKIKQLMSKNIFSIDVGCMQINMKYHRHNFKSVYEALEPRYNIGYAAKLLRRHYDKQKSWKKAIANYHAGSDITKTLKIRGQKYASKVLKHWNKEIKPLIANNNNYIADVKQVVKNNEKVVEYQQLVLYKPSDL